MAFINNTFNYYNTTFDHDTSLSSDIIITGVYYIIIFCISAPGNSFLLWVLLRERGWKKTPDNLILQLTVSALCFTLTLPFWACYQFFWWQFGCGVVTGTTYLGSYSCVWIITAMTFYHYVAVDHASCLSAQASKKLLLLTSTVIWLICGVVGIRSIYSITGEIHMTCFYFYMFSSYRWMMYYILIEFVLFFLIPFIIITFSCVYRATKQCKINRQHQESRLILGITIGLFLCLGPYDILKFIAYLEWLGIVEVRFWSIPDSVWLIISLLPHIHCCLNLVHICGAQRFRRYLCMPFGNSPQRREETQDVPAMAVMIQNDISV